MPMLLPLTPPYQVGEAVQMLPPLTPPYQGGGVLILPYQVGEVEMVGM